ncbi:MAG: hypothetical protein ABSD31_05935 [Candidatus Binataceae bacterium]
MNHATMCPPCRVVGKSASSLAGDADASIHLARNLMLSELPGLAFSVITVIYLVTSLIGLM